MLPIAEVAALAVATFLTLAGAVAALSSGNAMKRLAGVLVALVGAALALAALGAPEESLTTAVAIAFGYAVVGVAVIVRLQETYGGVGAAEVDAADAQSEPREPEA